jgi:hypothetical protein
MNRLLFVGTTALGTCLGICAMLAMSVPAWAHVVVSPTNTDGLWSPSMYSSLCPYPSDLSDPEWEIFAPLIPPTKHAGGRSHASGRCARCLTPSSIS